jgi:succinate dehydrogenase hydrophobic anchor subunit
LRRPEVKPAGRREATKDRVGAIASVAKRSGAELLGIAGELVRIPITLYMRIAERLGGLVLAIWLRIWPYLVAAWRLAGRALAWAQHAATPARVTVAVALLTAVALAGSQWADLSAISVGTDAYKGLEDVAPPPEVTTKTVGDTHSWIGIPLAIAAVLLIIGSARGRPGLARLLIPVGIAVVAVSVLIDRPEGLDKGNDQVAYVSVTADLLTGFWAQLVSGIVLILLAVVLARVLKPQKTARPAREGSKARRRFRPRGFRRAAEAGQ